jgi:hypothetical protein
MPPAIPTPFDISPIPVIPWSPGIESWITTIILIALAYATILGYRRVLSSRRFVAATVLQTELSHIQPLDNHADRQRLIKLTQRALIFLTSCDVRGLSSEELVALSTQESDGSVRKLLALLAALENDQYAPPHSHSDPEIREHARELYTALQDFLIDRRRT